MQHFKYEKVCVCMCVCTLWELQLSYTDIFFKIFFYCGKIYSYTIIFEADKCLLCCYQKNIIIDLWTSFLSSERVVDLDVKFRSTFNTVFSVSKELNEEIEMTCRQHRAVVSKCH